jgi:hypothetical protein
MMVSRVHDGRQDATDVEPRDPGRIADSQTVEVRVLFVLA